MTNYGRKNVKAPIIYTNEIAKQANVLGIAKTIMSNPWAKKALIGAGTGALVGGTAKMMAGSADESGKNFLRGAGIGAAGGAALGLGAQAFKAFPKLSPVKKVLTGLGTTAALAGGSALYFNQQKKNRNPMLGEGYKQQAPIQ